MNKSNIALLRILKVHLTHQVVIDHKTDNLRSTYMGIGNRNEINYLKILQRHSYHHYHVNLEQYLHVISGSQWYSRARDEIVDKHDKDYLFKIGIGQVFSTIHGNEPRLWQSPMTHKQLLLRVCISYEDAINQPRDNIASRLTGKSKRRFLRKYDATHRKIS